MKIAEDIQAGRSKHYKGLYFDYRYSTLPIEDFPDEKKLEHALYESYGSAAHSDDGKDYIILPDGRIEAVDVDGYSVEGSLFVMMVSSTGRRRMVGLTFMV